MKLRVSWRNLSFACVVASGTWGAIAWGEKRHGTLSELPFPDEAHSVELLSRSVLAIYPGGGKLIAMPEGKNFAMVTAFDAGGSTRDKVFGPMSEMQRLFVVKEDAPTLDWRGIDMVEDRALFFDGSQFSRSESDSKTMGEILRRSIPWDMVRPPRDPRGEPTTPETRR